MTNSLRLRKLLIGLGAASATIGVVVAHGSASTPPVAVHSEASAPATTAEPTRPGVVVAESTTTSSATVAVRNDAQTPSTTTTSIVSVPPAPTKHMQRRQPTGTLRSQYGWMDGTQSSACWRYDETHMLCACGPGWEDPDFSIDADPGEILPVTFDRDDAPRHARFTISDSFDGDEMVSGALESSNLRIAMPARPGTYWISTGTWWPEGDVSHVYKVNVLGTHPATATGSILGRTDGDPERTTLWLTYPSGERVEVKPDGVNRYRFDELLAGIYELEASIESYPAYSEPGEPQIGTALRIERRTVELAAGEIHREDFGTES